MGFFDKILDILKSIPETFMFLLKGLKFLVLDVPMFIFNVIKGIYAFGAAARPLIFAVIISFLGIYFGIQFLFGYLTGMNSAIPALPLAAFSMFILYDVVMNNNSQLKIFQTLLLNGFIFIFNNPLIKDIIGFDVNIDEKDPKATNERIIKWSIKNLAKIVFTLFAVAIAFKIFVQKSWSYITFYSEA